MFEEEQKLDLDIFKLGLKHRLARCLEKKTNFLHAHYSRWCNIYESRDDVDDGLTPLELADTFIKDCHLSYADFHKLTYTTTGSLTLYYRFYRFAYKRIREEYLCKVEYDPNEKVERWYE